MRFGRRREPVETLRPREPEVDDGLDLLMREVDGVEVTLFWSRSSGRTWIEAVNRYTDERLRFETAPARVLDVFYDSFAYFFSDAA
jgi:hypothetical protein